jgi:hypothetical protein
MLLVVCSSLAACAGNNSAMIRQRKDVFQVVNEDSGGADGVFVTISASIKTHNKESGVLFEQAKHGSDDYLLVIDINGQSLGLPVQTNEETTNTDPQIDPESGTGLRYNYKATLRMQPGRYTVTVSLPTESVTASQEVQISDNSRNITVKPLYRGLAGRKPASLRWVSTFKDGVSGLNIIVN